VDRNGKPDSVNAPARAYEAPRLSPDGSQVAVMAAGATQDSWVINLARGDATKLMGEGSNQFPVWRPDGKYLAYRATRAGTRTLFWQPADGSGSEERLMTGEIRGILPGSWSPNGQVLLLTEITATGRDIVGLRFPDRTIEPFLRTRFWESAPAFSPDGRWVAYVSDESGRQEIYVQPYPGPGGKSLISTDGGTEPLWHPKGRELFYRNGNKLMAVEIATRPAFAAGKPEELFTRDYMLTSASSRNYDVSLDGRRFLMIQPSAGHATPREIVVVLNWFNELKRLVPTR
jgi:eukaryotic-like serine/threonine-protein kinase